MEENIVQNIQNEILTVGCIYKNPDLYVENGRFIKSKYDFSDEAVRFFYDNFEIMFKTFSKQMDEVKVNTFMSQDMERLKTYRTYGGYKILKQWMSISNCDDFKNYIETVKKYSLLREFDGKGFNVKKIMDHKSFNLMKAEDIYKIMRSTVDKINTVILSDKDSININQGNEDMIKNWLIKPSMGLEIPFKLINEMFRGFNLGTLIALGFLSNEGKTRLATFIACWVAFVKQEKIYLMCNETSEEDIRACLLTTVINNDCFKTLHGVEIDKKERETVLGIYRDDNNNILERYEDEKGNFTESAEEYIQRVESNSSAFRNVLKVAKWIDSQSSFIYYKRLQDYSDSSLEFEIRKANLVHGVKYFIYDTLKGYKDENWAILKQTTTMLSDLMAELKCFMWCDIQLTDDSLYTDIFSFSSNNIANAKQLKHVLDYLILGKRLDKEEYHKYKIIANDDSWGENAEFELNLSKVYYGMKIDKNRKGSKDKIPAIEVDLDLNSWKEIGYLVKNKD